LNACHVVTLPNDGTKVRYWAWPDRGSPHSQIDFFACLLACLLASS
jgi:hypothetical protein